MKSTGLPIAAQNNVRVVLRVRPLLPVDVRRGESSAVAVSADERQLTVTVSANRRVETHRFNLGACFGPQVQQRELFHRAGVEAFCDGALDGHVATVFCFGQTGSGKTYSMSGPVGEDGTIAADDVGLQYRAAHYIMKATQEVNERGFAEEQAAGACGSQTTTEGGPMPIRSGNSTRWHSAARQPAVPVAGQEEIPQDQRHRRIKLRASYMEIYQENVNDLLNETTNLKMRWSNVAQSFFVEGLMMVDCDSLEDVMAVLEEGQKNRKRAEHNLNIDSSRSHSIFSLYIERQNDPHSFSRHGKINFVDLAGSERLRETGSNVEETKFINKSLFTLGSVIECLSKGSDARYIPYRDSTLTKLLMDSLGGNCMTLMVACITPSNKFTEDSLRTVSYALRASNIINQNPTVRIDPQQQQLFSLRNEVARLQVENMELKRMLGASTQPSLASVERTSGTYRSQEREISHSGISSHGIAPQEDRVKPPHAFTEPAANCPTLPPIGKSLAPLNTSTLPSSLNSPMSTHTNHTRSVPSSWAVSSSSPAADGGSAPVAELAQQRSPSQLRQAKRCPSMTSHGELIALSIAEKLQHENRSLRDEVRQLQEIIQQIEGQRANFQVQMDLALHDRQRLEEAVLQKELLQRELAVHQLEKVQVAPPMEADAPIGVSQPPRHAHGLFGQMQYGRPVEYLETSGPQISTGIKNVVAESRTGSNGFGFSMAK